MPRAILFDFNGVIVDDEPQHCEALIATLEEHGIPLSRDDYYREYLGFDDRECFRFTFERRKLRADDDAIEQAIARKATLYEAAIRGSMALVPGAEEFIRDASAKGYRLAVVSGALRREIELVLSLTGLRELFQVVVASEDVSACKPDPQGFKQAIRALMLPANGCVVIEDSLPGLGAARAAGLRCTMVATSHRPADLRAADLVWQDLQGHTADELPWSV
jgi:HAD superfamily hydrolase (TIGR01509 family)